MKPQGLRLSAAYVVSDVIDHGVSIDEAISRQKTHLDESMYPQLQEITFGAVRWFGYLDYLLLSLLKKPLKNKDRVIHFLLVVGMYQIRMMRVPDHAVVDQSVKEVGSSRRPWAKGLVNGVLREFARHCVDKPVEFSKKAHRLAFPEWLAKRIELDWMTYADEIMAASNEKPPFTLRVNQQKITRDVMMTKLDGAGIDSEQCVSSDFGVIITQPIPVQKVPGFTAGELSVQDESAQLVPLGLELKPGQHVLDGCAAPGGKTCHIIESEPALAHVTAVDLPDRVEAIAENLQRLELSASILSGSFLDSETFPDDRLYDRILMDVPCTGSGVIRRHPDIKYRRLENDPEVFSELQLQLLCCAWKKLQPGGILLYVTCSLLKQENDGVIKQFMESTEGVVNESLDEIFGFETTYGRQRLPGIHQGDGFYYSKLKKTEL